jgi:hypothetical protein
MTGAVLADAAGGIRDLAHVEHAHDGLRLNGESATLGR